MTLRPRGAQGRGGDARDRAESPDRGDPAPDAGEDASLPCELQLIFGENLRAARLKCGLTQAELAERAGTTVAYVSKVELGQRNLTLRTMKKLAEVVDHDVVHLLQRQIP